MAGKLSKAQIGNAISDALGIEEEVDWTKMSKDDLIIIASHVDDIEKMVENRISSNVSDAVSGFVADRIKNRLERNRDRPIRKLLKTLAG